MIIFGLATKENRCFGHGDYADVLSIQPLEAYGQGGFPPVFVDPEEAKRHAALRESLDFQVVDLDLRGVTPLADALRDRASLIGMLRRLNEKVKRANDIQHSGGTVTSEDWSELYDLTSEAGGLLDNVETS